MASFTFNLDSIKSTATASAAKFESGLYANTKDEDLIYKGDDYIVWDRSNAERLRRGLPSLADIGYPRPPEETTPAAAPQTAPDGTAKTFEVKGPPGLTREQALEIFKKQVGTGGLVGFKSGDILSAATQAADGLESAQASLQQSLAGVGGSLGRGAGSTVLDQAQSGIAQAGGALGGSLAGTAPGLSSLVGPAVTSLSGSAAGAVNTAQALAGGLAGSLPKFSSGINQALTAGAGLAGSVATVSIQNINKAITSVPVTNPINTADFAKAPTALGPIGNMNPSQVTATLAQATKLTGQAFDSITATGAGGFGLDVSQLETSGFVKPGTSNFVTSAAASVNSVLKSPSVWTGKEGIGSLSSLLNNIGAQSKIQQGLMTKGVADLGAVGVPVGALSAQGLAGMSLNAAKSLPSAEAFAKGLPIPGDVTGSVKAEFDKNVRDGAFAVNLADTKVPEPFKAIDIPVPKNNTVSRATVDAAATRIAGNDKIPPPNYGPPAPADESVGLTQLKQIQAMLTEIVPLLNKRLKQVYAADDLVKPLQNQQQITSAEWEAANAAYQSGRAEYNEIVVPKLGELNALYDRAESRVRTITSKDITTLYEVLEAGLKISKNVKEQLASLQNKIAGTGPGVAGA